MLVVIYHIYLQPYLLGSCPEVTVKFCRLIEGQVAKFRAIWKDCIDKIVSVVAIYIEIEY